MLKITRSLLFTLLIGNSLTINAMNQENHHLVVVPGQNGFGGGNVTTVLPHFADNRNLIHHVETPSIIIDFGQNRCAGYLKKVMSPLDKTIIHASSQGTATALNFTASHPEKVSALILEAVMLSGNSAISHTTKKLILPGISSLPGSYYWLPYAAKVIFPFYSPAGNQPIHNIDKLPKDLPIIILHCEQDTQLSFNDAQSLYAALRQKNNNVYLLPINSQSWPIHVEMLNKGAGEINIINAILQKHKLPHDQDKANSINLTSIDLIKIQPIVSDTVNNEWLTHFNELLRKENKIWYIDWGVKTAFYAFLTYILYRTGVLETIVTQAQSCMQ